MTREETRIDALWDALNRQDIDAALALLHPDVDWQDVMKGGRLKGAAAMRAYWTDVYALIRSDSSTLEYSDAGDGRVVARSWHSVRDLKGKLWTEETMTYVFSFRDGLISRMDLTPAD